MGVVEIILIMIGAGVATGLITNEIIEAKKPESVVVIPAQPAQKLPPPPERREFNA